MTKLDQIQQALKQINEGRFQKLCDVYLYKRGYGNVHPKGSVFGKEKTSKGTPDTWISLPNGKLAFVESTTQEKGLFDKLEKDINKCFDEHKTGVPITMIEKVIVCHNGFLEPDEEVALLQKCKEKGCLFENIGLDSLSFDLTYKYQGLAKDFLGIEIDSGQILQPSDFIKAYQKSPLSTPLDTDFFFREEELKQASSHLLESSILIISGRAGVGKSRFALEIMNKFIQARPEYIPYCIHNKGLSLYADLKSYFTIGDRYIIMVDDANRITQLDQVLHLTNESNLKIKLVLTVRDYALAKIKETCYEIAIPTELELSAFDKKQQTELLSNQFKITNSRYHERIWELAKGNTRLAVMAAKIAVETNRLDSLKDATELYDVYFSSIVKDLDQLENQQLLKVAGIISFFRVLDRTNTDFLKSLTEHFNTTPIEFWEGVHNLHSLEIVDLFESEVVKISDQVLATYMFYKCFISERMLDFSILLEHFFYNFPNKFKESLYPIIDTFERDFVLSRIQSAIDAQWHVVENDDEKWLLFSSVFWFLKPTDTLFYFKRHIDMLNPNSYELNKLEFDPDESIPPISFLGVLSLFQFAAPQDFKTALELIFYYLEVRPSILPSVMYLFRETFCFQKESYYQNYSVQHTIIERLLLKIKTNQYSQLYTKILLNITGKYLGSRFESNRMESKNTVTLYQFNLILTAELKSIRKQILDFLISLYQDATYRGEVLQIIKNYFKYPRNQPEREIVEFDSHLLLPFISTSLDPDQYFHCIIVNDYLRHLDMNKVTYDSTLKARFANESYKLAQILLEDLEQRVDLGYEEYQVFRQQRIQEYFSGYDFDNYKEFIGYCFEIANYDERKELPERFFLVLKNLADTNPHLFQEVFVYFLGTGNQLNFYDFRIADLLISTSEDIDATYKILMEREFASKFSWIHAFLMLLPQENINQYFVDELFYLYESAPLQQLLRGFDFLQKYSHFVENIFVEIAKIIFSRISRGDGAFSFWNLLQGNATRDRLEEFFADDVEFLKQIYFYETSQQSLLDYDGFVFQKILNLDPNFITHYLEWMYSNYDYLSDHSDHRDYSFIWHMPNYQQIMTKVIFFISNRSEKRISGKYANTFFVNRNNDPAIAKRIKRFLTELINAYSSNTNLMSIAFDVISELFQEHLSDFLSLFLDKNKKYEDFQYIRFEIFDPVVWGNQISEHEKRIEQLESILPLMNSLDLLQHKQLIEKKVLFWRKEIERINRDAFIDDDW